MTTTAYWPTTAWQTCAPEAQGMDSDVLDQAYAYLTTNSPALRQLTIVRHGQIVFHRENPDARESAASVVMRRLLKGWGSLFRCPPETFVHNYQHRWNVRLVAKSVTSILLGIALADRVLDDLSQYVADILPEYFADVAEAGKRQITLRHLLTMTSGLRSVERGFTAFQMLASANWTRFMAHLPLESQPGERFTYNSANAHLLSALVTKATGKSLLDYANERLFLPLGIREVCWGAGPEGVTFGGGNLFLSSLDLAKIGLLYLHQGVWRGRQLVPSTWVAESLQPHQVFLPGWDYGYYWYLHDESDDERKTHWATFSAAGTGGQKLLMVPELDLILAAVAKTDFVAEKGIFLNRAVAEYLLPAVQDE